MIVDLLFFLLHDGTGERGNTQKLSQLYRNKELSIPAKDNREQAYSHPNQQRATIAQLGEEAPIPSLHFLKT